WKSRRDRRACLNVCEILTPLIRIETRAKCFPIWRIVGARALPAQTLRGTKMLAAIYRDRRVQLPTPRIGIVAPVIPRNGDNAVAVDGVCRFATSACVAP